MSKIKLTQEQFKTDLVSFYRNVAMELGYEETESTKYDCREINVASNIQDAWFEYYKETYKAETWEVAMLLACSGAKVDKELSDNEVEIFDGFITEGE